MDMIQSMIMVLKLYHYRFTIETIFLLNPPMQQMFQLKLIALCWHLILADTDKITTFFVHSSFLKAAVVYSYVHYSIHISEKATVVYWYQLYWHVSRQ